MQQKLQSEGLIFSSHMLGWRQFHRFFACLLKHAQLRLLTSSTAYWVCAYANNQHALHEEISTNPRKTSFYKAMSLCVGVLLILDHINTARELNDLADCACRARLAALRPAFDAAVQYWEEAVRWSIQAAEAQVAATAPYGEKVRSKYGQLIEPEI